MAKHLDTGIYGESMASEYLIKRGYVIKARNYRFGRAEIDIIAEKDNILSFVEVKTRSDNSFGYPETFVSERKADKIREGAESYLEQNNWPGHIRFDIIAVEIIADRTPLISHFMDAF
ncbi:MAG: YraN family protein [Cyclobacteriaceae bacterium]|nr:YraN family protein [Cyclobacteriaceae bacterium]